MLSSTMPKYVGYYWILGMKFIPGNRFGNFLVTRDEKPRSTPTLTAYSSEYDVTSVNAIDPGETPVCFP
jgi:hypothetical protein